MLQIITDSASDITLEQAARMNVHIVQIKIEFEDGVCPQESEQDFGIFYDRLEKAKELPVTSQPSPELYLQYFNAAKEAGDEVLVLALSSGLSGTINGINVAKEMCDYDPIYILDSRQAIAGQRVLVEHAVTLRDAGVPTERIITELEKLRDRISIIGVIDTLEYLKKGGRIPASLGMLGNALRIKPVIILEDRILKTVGKALGHAAGKRQLCSRFENELPDPNFPIYFLYSSNRQMGGGIYAGNDPKVCVTAIQNTAAAGRRSDRNPHRYQLHRYLLYFHGENRVKSFGYNRENKTEKAYSSGNYSIDGKSAVFPHDLAVADLRQNLF